MGTDPQDIDTDTIAQSSKTLFPARLRSFDRWMTWKEDDGQKIPRAPQNGGPELYADAMDEDNWMGFERAREYVDMLASLSGLTFTTVNDDGLVLLDYDDVRDPETGETVPIVKEHIERVGGFAQVSTSGTGIHLIVEGDLPGDIKSMTIDLPGGDEAELEVYPGDRFIAMTGDMLECSDSVVRDGQDLIDDLVAECGDDAAVRDSGARAEEWEPDKDREEIVNTDTTSDTDDIFDAIKHTTLSDIRLRSELTEGRNDSRKSFDPSWEHSDSGTRLGYDDDTFIYRKGNIGLDALQVVALEERIIHDPRDYPEGEDFWEAVEKLRDRGAPIPEYDPPDDEPEHVVVLPDAPPAGEWDWRSAGEGISAEGMPSRDEAQARVGDRMEEIWDNSEDVLMEALPGLGKSYGSVLACARTGQKTTIYTARHDLYGQYRAWCEQHDLTYYTLPSMPRDCPTASGEFGEEWRERVMDWYKRGATPKAIHAHAENATGQPLPCQEDGHCPYSAKWDFDPDEFDVLIGHYTHAYKSDMHSGRIAVFDEFPEDTYTTPMGGGQFKAAVTHYLARQDDIPMDDFAELIAFREEEEAREQALAHFDSEIDTDPEGVLYDDAAHANAPIAVYTLLSGGDLGNGYEAARLPSGDRGIVQREDLSVWAMHTPDLTYASGVVALDGTPTEEMWRTVLDTRLDTEQPLSDDERRHYLANTAGINVVKTTDTIRPYSSGKYVDGNTLREDAALVEAIRDEYNQKPALITTKEARSVYENEGVLEHVSHDEHYGNLKGSNRLASTRLGVILGSRHYGDNYIKRWGAFKRRPVESNGEKGKERSYGEFGDKILTHMREHETLQALLRFGRDGGGATVFVHTDTLPDWVPVYSDGATIKVWSDGMQEVIETARDVDSWTTADIASRCDISKRQVLTHLKRLTEMGYVTQIETGNGYKWDDDALAEASENGHVEFDNIDVDVLTEQQVDEVARTVVNTWDFAPVGSVSGQEEPTDAHDPGRGGGARADGGGDGPAPPG